MKDEDDDGLDKVEDDDTPTEPFETTYQLAFPPPPAEGNTHPDGDHRGRSGADRDEPRDGLSELRGPGELPTVITFVLRTIRSMSAPCFFCKDIGCDQVFWAKSRVMNDARAYAVHSQCVFDHDELQALTSGGA